MKRASRVLLPALLLVMVTGIVHAQVPPPTYDLRNVNGENYVTAVKAQQGGTCWTHGAMSAIEGNLLMTGAWAANKEVGEPNLAEYHLDWWNGFNRHNNDDTNPPTGGGLTVHYGGDYMVTAAYLARGEGAVREIDGGSYLQPPKRSDLYFHYYYTPTIEWYTAGSNLENIDDIKQAIMDHGVVGTSMAYSGAFINGQFEHYQPWSSSVLPNHAIAIIGWDDNRDTQASKHGAWLCKNSWGANWGLNGFFWISYYDKVACQHHEMGAISYQDVEPMFYDFIYSHDYHGWRDTLTDVKEAFNAFTATAPAEKLHAVSFYTATENVAFVAKIYDRFESGALLDELAAKSGVFAHRGYHTVKLDTPLLLSPGDDFYVHVELDQGGHAFDRTSEVPVLLGASARVTVESSASPGESYYWQSNDWEDLTDFNDTANFCIKALTAIEPAVNIALPNDIPDGPFPIGVAVPITLQISPGMENYVAGSGKLHYRFDPDDPYSTVPITPLGGDLYEAMVPHSMAGAKPQFYFSAEGHLGGVATNPKKAPDLAYSYDVFLRELMVFDECESATGWKVKSYDLLDGEWECADPEFTDAQPEDDHSLNGTRCWVTGRQGGTSSGDDVDGGPTYLVTPGVDIAGGDAIISFWLWFHHSTSGKQQPLLISVANNGISFMPVMTIEHAPQWTYYEFTVSDYVEPSSHVQVEFRAWDNPNDSVVEALVDDFKVEFTDYYPTLWADGYAVSAATGAQIRFTLQAGAENAGRKYLLLGGLSGTLPGFTLPGGEVLPVNWDLFTDILLQFSGTPVCQDFMGVLDGQGGAVATLDTLGALNPAVVGLTASFAYLLSQPPAWDFTSNPIDVTFEP